MNENRPGQYRPGASRPTGQKGDSPNPSGRRIARGADDVYRRDSIREGRSLRVVNLIYSVFGLLASALLLRFALVLFDANRSLTPIRLLFDLTGPLVRPFASYNSATLELGALVAIPVLFAFAWLLTRMARALI
jgi:uncharacterized protein YggT (Ycf19 family)